MPTKRKASTAASDLPRPRNGPFKVVELVSNGDVLLKVGKGDAAVDMRASAVVLGLASEVFSKMLSSDFVERQVIEGQAKVINLPEDEPETVVAFCKIIHHATDDLEPQSPDTVMKLGLMADMRFATRALRPWILMYLAGAIEEVNKIYESNDVDFSRYLEDGVKSRGQKFSIEWLLRIALLFRLESLFWHTTRLTIMWTWASNPTGPSNYASYGMTPPEAATLPSEADAYGKRVT